MTVNKEMAFLDDLADLLGNHNVEIALDYDSMNFIFNENDEVFPSYWGAANLNKYIKYHQY